MDTHKGLNKGTGAVDSAIIGAGLGLRTPHIPEILASEADIPWFELLADNWLYQGGLNAAYRDAICERYPVVLHGVGLSLGATDVLDWDYLKSIKQLMLETGAHWYSEHASFSLHQGRHIPDLLPMPYTDEAIRHLAGRICQVQDFLQQPMLLENVSSYLQHDASYMDEASFFAAVVDEADCDILLDLNNLYVSHRNHAVDMQAYLKRLPADKIKQIHLAGFSVENDMVIDTHGSRVAEPVWQMYRQWLSDFPQALAIPAMIEWDNQVPDFSTLTQERDKICQIHAQHAVVAA